jgi:hypothetical protein
MLDSFIAWHQAIGFERLFLFFDDPNDPDLPRLAAHPAVAAMAHDAALRARWTGMPEYPALEKFTASEVMARQVLNVGVAMEMARTEGLDWLLHIDADELFFPGDRSLADIFAADADALRFFNYEAVPEKENITDPFREVDLFKIPPALAPGPFTAEGQALLQSTPQLPQGLFFHFYSNGKSAVRLGSALRPDGVHRFGGPGAHLAESPAAFVLHYACCGFNAFWDKYAALGRFADRWMEKDDIRAAIGPLHLDARDVVATANREAALAFYRGRLMLNDPARIEALISHRVLTRISGPRRTLERLG